MGLNKVKFSSLVCIGHYSQGYFPHCSREMKWVTPLQILAAVDISESGMFFWRPDSQIASFPSYSVGERFRGVKIKYAMPALFARGSAAPRGLITRGREAPRRAAAA